MKKAVVAASAAVLTVGLVSASPAQAKPGPGAPQGQTTKLTKAVTVNGILKHLRQFQAIANRDLLVVRNVVMLLAAAVVVINFVVDVLYVVIDPRLRGRAAE